MDDKGGGGLSVLTWNLLAPCYIRAGESAAQTQARQVGQQALLAREGPDVITLQEFWHWDAAYVRRWHAWSDAHGYTMFTLPRTSFKRDGCCTLVRSRLVRPRPASDAACGFGFNDWGDRVVLMVHVCLGDGDETGLLVCNTHWTFPHPNDHDPVMRVHQSRKLCDVLDEHFGGAPVVVAGDLNGAADDAAVAALQHRGFQLNAAATGAHTHYTHNKTWIACDYVATRGCCAANEVRVLGSADDMAGTGRLSDHVPVATVVSRA